MNGTIPRYAAWALGALFAGSLALGFFALKVGTQSDIFRFIALLIIFLTALAASSALYTGLSMGSRDEAFGLPSGSMRALLAIGIMILFVVFGLPMITPRQTEVSAKEVSVPVEQLAATIRLNREQGFEVRILDPGVAGTASSAPSQPPAQKGAAGNTAAPAPATAPAKAGPARPAKIEIVRMTSASAGQTDLNKQMLTAIITLLTTVVGFYFGSRSATDGARRERARNAAERADRRRGAGEAGERGEGGAVRRRRATD
jgi:hypothetical protein